MQTSVRGLPLSLLGKGMFLSGQSRELVLTAAGLNRLTRRERRTGQTFRRHQPDE